MNALVPREAKESLPDIHEEPPDNRLSGYLLEVAAARPQPIRFNVYSGHIFHELLKHWPDTDGHEAEKKALCSRIAEITYRLASQLYAESVSVTIATAPPA